MKLRFLTLAPALALLCGPADAADAPSPPALPVVTAPALSLRAALQIAAQNSVPLKQAGTDAAAAAAAASSANAATKPGLSTTTYATTGDSSNTFSTSPGVDPRNVIRIPPRPFADQNLMLEVPLLTGGRLSNNAAAAQTQGDAARLTLQASRLTVTEAVTEAYADAALQAALVAVASARLSAEDEQVRITQEKVRTGRLAPVDLLREQAEEADAGESRLAAGNSALLSLVRLKTVLGVSQASVFTLSDSLDALTPAGQPLPATLPDALRLAAARRPELAAALKQVDAAESRVRAARAAYAPQVYGVAMADASAGAGVGRNGYTVGLTASLPLYDGGQRRADVDAAKARVERAKADAQQAEQQVEEDTASAWLMEQTAAAQVPVTAAGVAAAQEGYALAALRYNAGKSTTAERLDALAALVRAQGAFAQARADVVSSRARLRAAVGS